MENKYNPYSLPEIRTMLVEPWEISDKPYRLHAAFAISSLFDTFEPDNDDEELDPFQNFWGQTLPKKIVDRLAVEIATDFNDAADNRKPIKIWGKSYSIRKVNAYNHGRLTKIFNFPLNEDGEYIIQPEGILNLAGPTPDSLKNYEVSQSQFQLNKKYLRQIVKLAEDDENNGWDQLTDMEILVYCWAMFYNKNQTDNLKQFLDEYKDYIYVTQADIQECLNEKSSLREKPIGMYAFSSEKIQEWHSKHNMKSLAIEISETEADDYWYQKALQSTFKPIDER